MKKYFLLITLVSLCLLLQAQDYNSIKNLAVLQNYQQAKDKFDIAIKEPAFGTKPEAYILKATVYSGLAGSNNIKGTATADDLIKDADAAFIKYRAMDASLGLLSDQVYQMVPINIYSAFYISGYNDYQNKNWQPGFTKLKKAVEYSDLLINKKLLVTSFDTNVLVLAGLVAENAGLKDEAAKYYSRLADASVSGSSFESLYRYLVSYNFTKKNYAAFEKYRVLGKSLFPQSVYFTFDKVDFAVGLVADFNKKMQVLDDLLAEEPNNQKANEVMGELIYDTLNAVSGVQHSNAAQLEQKMVTAFHKSAAQQPGYENPFIYIGDHFINKSVTIKETETKTGTTAAMEQQYLAALDVSRENYEKAAVIFAAKTTLTEKDKVQYKKVTGYLTDIYAIKKIAAKGNAADEAKYAAAEKKWNDVNAAIK